MINSTETLGPGISLQHVQALAQSGWYNAQFMTVDLSNSAVSTELLTSGSVASGGPLSVAVNKAGAVGGINGEFFDIGNSNAAEGAEIQGGQLVKTSDVPLRPSVGVSNDGIAQLVDTTVNATANFSSSDHTVLSAGTPVFTDQPADAKKGEVQKVTVTNTGTQPLQVTGASIANASAADPGAFTVVHDTCTSHSVAPGHSCFVSVQFAPTQPDVTSTASLVLTSNTAAGTTTVPLTATSTGLTWPAGGDGPAQDALPADITWAAAQ